MGKTSAELGFSPCSAGWARPFLPLSVLVFLMAAAPAPAQLPEELSHLEQLSGQEEELIDAAREYGQRQVLLAEWDKTLAEKHAKAGEKDMAETKLAKARERLQSVRTAYEFTVRLYPKNARAQNYYGELLYDHFGEWPGAIMAWQQATFLDPDLSTPYNNLAIHYCHVGDYSLALRDYDKALELEPENPDYLFNLAQMYLVNGPQVQQLRKWDKARNFREAMKLSKKAAKLDPKDFELAQDYAVNFFAAENFGVEADWQLAAKAWQAARPLARNKAQRFFTWLNEGRVWIRAEEPHQAAACLEQALQIMPDSAVARELLEGLQEAEPKEDPSPKTPRQRRR